MLGAPSRAELIDAFGALCDEAGARGLLVHLEFMPFSAVKSLADAVEVVQGASRANGGIMLDVWHLKRAFAMQNPKANASGLVVSVAAFALLFTGLFIFTKANSEANRWAFVSHQVLALVVPAGYVFHRLVARHAPKPRTLVLGFAAPGGDDFATFQEGVGHPHGLGQKPAGVVP